MRMFLIVMCDIFLMLYLTAVINVTPGTVLTVEDFYQLKSMHETLESDKENAETEFQEKLKQAQEEKERLLEEKKKQEELTAARLVEEKARLSELQQSLVLSDSERERVNKDLQIKEAMLKNKEQLLEDLNKQIESKESIRRKMQEVYQSELEDTRKAVQESQKLVEQLKSEADNAQSLTDQMKEEVSLAYKTAETAKAVQQKALVARKRAEEERQMALQGLETEKASREKAEQNAQKLTEAIEDIKQDGEAAYQKNMRPKLQTINVSYERKTGNDTFVYKRELSLLPVAIDGKITVVFPSRQIGFTGRSDKAPTKLVIMYLGQPVTSGLINTQDDLIALSLSTYQGKANPPFPSDTEITELMPVLIALRNNGNVGLTDKIRGISDDYFIVNRDYLQPNEDGGLKFEVSGFRGTGTRAERIVRGDQLVDLNGRLIGVANNANRVIRISTLSGWTEIKF